MVRRIVIASCLSLLSAAPLLGFKDNPSKQPVDQGTFIIYVQGRRVGSEKFTIEQRSDMNVTTSQVEIEDGTNKGGVGSELQLYPNGDLRHYDWKETNPGHGATTVDYSETFLVEHIIANPGDKPHDLTFMLPPSTNVLDDYFFVQRELLLWKYMAACANAADKTRCPKQQFGVFVPRQQSSALINLEYKGREKVTVKGALVELDRFDLTGDTGEWTLWTDQNRKLVRLIIPAENTEVVRE